MYDEIVEKMLGLMDDKSAAAVYPKFSGEGYKAHRIGVENFHEINSSSNDDKIAFVDGGNAEIISAANLSLSLVRVGYSIYRSNKKISAKRFEIFAFTQALSQNNEIYYKTSFFSTGNSIELEEISFSSFDNTLMHGVNRAEIGGVANAIRRFAELKLAKIVAEKKIAGMIVLDGNLQATITNENNYLSGLYESCMKNNIILTALSKTTSLFADDGSLLSVVLGNMGAFPIWFYHPVAEINNQSHKAEMFFVKFHEKSKHIFRFEIFKNQKIKAEEAISELACSCIDPIFIGYPYGLVEADRIARISNNEKESLKTMFLVKLRNKNVEKYLSSVNAHEILDRISF